MNLKNCEKCGLEKPLKMFAVKRNGTWLFVVRCRACRKLAKPFHRFWRKLSPEIRERNRMARRARAANSPVIIPFTKSEIIKRDGLNCYLCGKFLTFKSATIDHVIPLSRGGFHCASNAKIACRRCNNEKYNKIEEGN
jgi:5-methylcytosine-specific restriction endonuclease McrA